MFQARPYAEFDVRRKEVGKGYAQPRWRSAAAARLRYAYESTKTTRGTTDALQASNHLRSVAILDNRERDVLRCIRVILAPGTATPAWRDLGLASSFGRCCAGLDLRGS